MITAVGPADQVWNEPVMLSNDIRRSISPNNSQMLMLCAKKIFSDGGADLVIFRLTKEEKTKIRDKEFVHEKDDNLHELRPIDATSCISI
jgi:hypothetical protein